MPEAYAVAEPVKNGQPLGTATQLVQVVAPATLSAGTCYP